MSAHRGVYCSSRTDLPKSWPGRGRGTIRRGEGCYKEDSPPRSYITRVEQKVLKELREDNMRIVLTEDKGVCVVLIDREEYMKKAKELLNQPTYKVIPADPTTKQKLITLVKNIKEEGGINKETYRRMYLTDAGTSKFYWLPKIHKAGVPLRPIVFSRGAESYDTAKELARILTPIVGKSPYNVHNTRYFVQQMKSIHLPTASVHNILWC